MDPTAPDYSVILPAFNEEELLGSSLAALARAMQSVAARGEVVVCDNNSTDRTAEIARDRGARVVFEPVNQISRARNRGAGAALGRHLVFLDADSEVSAELLGAALAALESGRVVGGGAPVSLGEGQTPGTARLVTLWNRLSRWRRLAAGSFVFARRDAFEAVGGFSRKVYASEEIWLSRALGRWGRERGLEFVILEGPPLLTSDRKVQWYPGLGILWRSLPLLLCPLLVRSRAFCGLWYRRPAAASLEAVRAAQAASAPPE